MQYIIIDELGYEISRHDTREQAIAARREYLKDVANVHDRDAIKIKQVPSLTKKQFIEQNNGKMFKRTVIKGATTDDMPKMLDELKRMASEQGFTVKNHDHYWAIKDGEHETGQRFFKPVLPREKLGIMHFKSNRTEFDGGVGELPLASEIDGDAFTKDYGNIAYRYELVK